MFFFYFSQAVWRNVTEKGIAVEYRTNPDLQRHVRSATTSPTQPSAGRLDGCPEQQSRPSKSIAVQRLHHRDMGGRRRQISATTLEPVGPRGTLDQQQS